MSEDPHAILGLGKMKNEKEIVEEKEEPAGSQHCKRKRLTEVLKAPTPSPAKTDSCNPFHNRTLPPLNRLTWLTTRSSNDRWEMAADIQTGEQYSSTWSMNAQKHLATTATSRKTLIVFLKMPTLLEAEASIALTCFFIPEVGRLLSGLQRGHIILISPFTPLHFTRGPRVISHTLLINNNNKPSDSTDFMCTHWYFFVKCWSYTKLLLLSWKD